MRSGVIAGKAARNSRVSPARAVYCASVYGSVSVPSSSMPREKSLHASRPSKQETPACQARSVVTGDELGDGAVAFDEEMRGNRQVADLLEIGMFVRVQAILEERLDLAGAELSRRQADIVDDQQRHRVPLRTQVEIR